MSDEAPSPWPAIDIIVEPKRTVASRPLGISILAFVSVIGGLLLFGMHSLLVDDLQLMLMMRASGIPPVFLIIGGLFLAILTFATGVGLWLGTKWGWWLASFYCVYSIFRNCTGMLNALVVIDQFEGSSRGPEYYVVKHTGRVVVYFLLYLYLFKGNVLEYFRSKTVNKGLATSILFGICFAITAVASMIAWFSTRSNSI